MVSVSGDRIDSRLAWLQMATILSTERKKQATPNKRKNRSRDVLQNRRKKSPDPAKEAMVTPDSRMVMLVKNSLMKSP